MRVSQSVNYSGDEVRLIVQKAVNDAYERAAKVADDMVTGDDLNPKANDSDYGYVRAGNQIAAEIRKLKGDEK